MEKKATRLRNALKPNQMETLDQLNQNTHKDLARTAQSRYEKTAATVISVLLVAKRVTRHWTVPPNHQTRRSIVANSEDNFSSQWGNTLMRAIRKAVEGQLKTTSSVKSEEVLGATLK